MASCPPTRCCATAFPDAERVHLIGLVSDGGVHSGSSHCEALIRIWRRARACPTWSCTRSPTAATRCRTSGAGFLAEVEGWMARGRGRADRLGHRPLLRDGPRQALGPGAARLRPARPRARRALARTAARRRRARPTSATRPTSSSRRCWSARRRRIRPGDSVIGVQLPPRPDARDHPGARRSGLRRDRPRRRRAGRALRDDDRVRGGLAVPGRVPARASGDHAGRGDRRPTAGASCTSPRPRSTRT